MSREEESFRGKTRRKNEKGRGTLARLYSKLISSPPFHLNPTYFSSFRFCRGSSTIRYAAEFFRVKRICSPRITFPSGNIFVSISLSLSPPLLSSRTWRYDKVVWLLENPSFPLSVRSNGRRRRGKAEAQRSSGRKTRIKDDFVVDRWT